MMVSRYWFLNWGRHAELAMQRAVSLPTDNRLGTLKPTLKTKAGMVKMNARTAGRTGHDTRAGIGNHDQTLDSCVFLFFSWRD